MDAAPIIDPLTDALPILWGARLRHLSDEAWDVRGMTGAGRGLHAPDMDPLGLLVLTLSALILLDLAASQMAAADRARRRTRRPR